MGDLFDAAAMYDEDYLHFFAAPSGLTEFAAHGPVVPGDRVINWSTAFGYFDDTTNRAVLDGIAGVLKPVAGWPWTWTT